MATQLDPSTAVASSTSVGMTAGRTWWMVGSFAVLLTVTLLKFNAHKGDLPVYLFGARQMIDGQEIYLRAGDPRLNVLPFTYPPFFAFVFIPLAMLPESLQRSAWALVTSCAFAATFWLLYLCVKPLLPAVTSSRDRTWKLFWLGLAIVTGRHVLSIWEIVSHDVLTLLCTVACVYAFCRANDKVAGILAGAAAACKATPLLFAPVFLWQRKWAAAFCVVGAATALTFLPDLLTPSQSKVPWVLTWTQTFLRNVKPGEAVEEEGSWHKWNEANQSLAGSLYRLQNVPGPYGTVEWDVSLWNASPSTTKYVTLSAQLAVLGIVCWGTRYRSQVGSWPVREQWSYRLGQGAIVATAMPLLSPMSSKSHFGVLILPVAYCLATLLSGRRDNITRSLLVAMFVIGTLTVKGVVGTATGRYILGYGTVTWCTLAALLAAARTLQLQLAAGNALPIPAAGRKSIAEPHLLKKRTDSRRSQDALTN